MHTGRTAVVCAIVEMGGKVEGGVRRDERWMPESQVNSTTWLSSGVVLRRNCCLSYRERSGT